MFTAKEFEMIHSALVSMRDNIERGHQGILKELSAEQKAQYEKVLKERSSVLENLIQKVKRQQMML